MNSVKSEVSEHLLKRILRKDELIACKTAFIDTRTPGSDQKENFCLIGGGVAENPGQVIHINIPHGFDIGAARQPNGCKNSHHSHDTEEVFVVHRGRWKFTLGETGEDGEVILDEGDTISIPQNVFRGFENVGPDDGFLFCILGHYPNGTAGNVTWAPYVFKNAKEHGLILLKDGRLIDTAEGQTIPEDGEEYTPVSGEKLASFRRLSKDEALDCVDFNVNLKDAPKGGLSTYKGVSEYAVIGCANEKEKIPAGKLGWEHGFQHRRLVMEPGAIVPKHKRSEEEVLFVHMGSLHILTEEGDFTLDAGDLTTIPIGLVRSFVNETTEAVDVLVVRRGQHPDAAQVS